MAHRVETPQPHPPRRCSLNGVVRQAARAATVPALLLFVAAFASARVDAVSSVGREGRFAASVAATTIGDLPAPSRPGPSRRPLPALVESESPVDEVEPKESSPSPWPPVGLPLVASVPHQGPGIAMVGPFGATFSADRLSRLCRLNC